MNLDWNKAYEENRMPWDKGAAAPPLLEYLERVPVKGRVFVPGCGLGHDVRALAAQGAEPLGFDISPKALEMARGIPAADQESYHEGDLFNLPESLIGAFDWVFEHTCLSALHPTMRPDYIKALRSTLKPGGKMVAIFFINPWDEGETPEPPPYGIEIHEIDAMIEGSFTINEEWEPLRHYPGRVGRELMRVMTRA